MTTKQMFPPNDSFFVSFSLKKTIGAKDIPYNRYRIRKKPNIILLGFFPFIEPKKRTLISREVVFFLLSKDFLTFA